MSSKKIAIIGGGWLGCHMAYKLKQHHDVTLFDKSGIFSGSSFFNQNRLHKGFHYSRNQKTRNLCQNTFNTFIQDYPDLVSDIDDNYYVVPIDNSLIDYGTFKTIFTHEQINFAEKPLPDFNNIEGSVIIDEKYIDPVKSKTFFQHELRDIFIMKSIDESELKLLAKQYDYVINVTNNQLKPLSDHFFELSLTMIYDRISANKFGSVTMVDGPLFSIYPYMDNQYTVTDVEYTPVYTSERFIDIQEFSEKTSSRDLLRNKEAVEQKIAFYYKNFLTDFAYNSYYTSVKVKRYSESADRAPVIVKHDNIITCITGKIQGIYTLENYINENINR
jgi:hypothetical protein